MAIADADYFDWPALPEAPSGLRTPVDAFEYFSSNRYHDLEWDAHGGTSFIVERRVNSGQWTQETTTSTKINARFSVLLSDRTCYRVRAINAAGSSAFSNIHCESNEK
jgi:hypothetical protein